ncbi:RNA polymerase II subunit 5-mediating protein homolog isoform X2 [Papaver somniferum]|uniref:RNA polymerase II subunit 5-mediating protein homolog isoform X2 n=1 Tax=Papaver somniferum TaxID=3469 RepID=UPI000E6FE819|nr:RNA polymerase II subunit 5-mediating protein homolog isoform X2 [Papaver somniferum]
MEQREKGTVTSLASLVSVEEAQKAAKRVEGSIAEHQKELDNIRHFISDNNNLINLVHKLPDELHHDIMVPFGKAAFFPGRLVHTNEFTVLLGEGYYVQRTSKQTVGILQRRGEVLDSQVESLKAMMLDLKAEASFFGSTAAEAAEGVFEIREEYVEEHPTERMSNKADLEKPDTSSSSEVHNVEVSGEDEEYARIMSRLNELEKEELEAEHVNEDTDFGCSINEHSFEQLKISQVENLTVQQPPEVNYLHRESLQRKGTSNPTKPLQPEKEKAQVVNTSKTEISDDKASKDNPETGFDSTKAFTGSVVEHTHGLLANAASETTSSQSTGLRTSKPVSRFKMQKGSR